MDRSATLHNIYILAVFSYLPTIVIFIGNFIQTKNLIIRAPNLKINYTFAKWTTEDIYAASIWIGFISFLILAALKHIFRDLSIVPLSAGPILLVIGGTLTLSIEYFKLSEIYENYSKTIKTIFVISAITVSYKASTMTNASIAGYTHTNASNFPDAQKVITTLASIGCWIYAAVIISLLAYASIAIITFFKMITNDCISEKESRYMHCLIGTPPQRSNVRTKELIILISLLLGASMTVSAPLAYFKLLKVSSIEKIVKDLLVETSFQLSPELCGVRAPTGSSMSLLPFRQAAIAIPDDSLTYRFSIIECSRTFDKLPKLVDDKTSSRKTNEEQSE